MGRTRRHAAEPPRAPVGWPRMSTRLPLLMIPAVVLGCGNDLALPVGAGTAEVFVENLGAWNQDEWPALEGPRGRGELQPAAVSHVEGRLLFKVGGRSLDGGAVASATRWDVGAVTVQMKVPRAPGSAAVILLTPDLGAPDAEAVALELLADGSRTMRLVSWRAGRRVRVVSHSLPFDPADAFYELQIQRLGGEVAFAGSNRFLGSLHDPPDGPLGIVVGVWFPDDLTDPAPLATAFLEVESITIRVE